MSSRGVAAAALAIGAGFGVLLPSASAADRADRLRVAATIQAEVDARYQQLRVTEASSTGVIDSFTLFGPGISERVVPAADGIFYALCPPRARCPYPSRRARPVAAFEPRRAALELAIRTFTATTANLVAVSLPTRRFVLLIVERAEIEVSDLTAVTEADPAQVPSADVRRLVDRTTLPHLFEPLWLEPLRTGRHTLVALSLQ